MITINGIELEAFVDFGNGFKFLIEDIEMNNVECYGTSFLFKVNPSSLKWVEIEHDLNNSSFLKGYNQFLAECDEAEEEFWKELYEDSEAERWVEEYKNIF